MTDVSEDMIDHRSYANNLEGLGHAILGNFCLILLIMSSKRQIGRPKVFHSQNHGLITTENDLPAE